MTDRVLQLAVLISGTGRTLKNLLERDLPARVRVVVSTVAGAKGLRFAEAADIPAVTVERKKYADVDAFSAALAEALEPHDVDYVLMAGLIHLWKFPARYDRRVLNIHPALLPDFGGRGYYGHRVHEAVIQAGAKESGCTVHFADHEYDHGPVVLQRRVPVKPDDTPDTLAARVFEEECEAYPEAIRKLAEQVWAS